MAENYIGNALMGIARDRQQKFQNDLAQSANWRANAEFATQQNAFRDQQATQKAKMNAEQVLAGARIVQMAAQKGQSPKAVAEQISPNFVSEYDNQHGPGSWAALDDQTVLKMAQGLEYHAMQQLGQSPPQPTLQKLGPGDTLIQTQGTTVNPTAAYTAPAKESDAAPTAIMGPNGKGVFVSHKEAIGKQPFSQQDANSQAMAGALTPEGLDIAAEKYRVTGTLPTGLYRVPGATAKIISRAAQMAAAQGDDASAAILGQQANKASQTALGALTKQQTLVGSFEKTASKNMDLALQLSNEVDRTGVPIINKGLIHFRQNITGDPATAKFVNALVAARTEYAKVLSGATGAQGVTDSARREAEHLFSTATTPEALPGVIETAKQEMRNRMQSFDEQKQELLPGLTSKPAQSSPRGSQGPVKVNTPQEALALPPGTQFMTPDGRVKVRP